MASKTAASSPYKLHLTEEIVITVGKPKKRFTVPKTFLVKSSNFFPARCLHTGRPPKTIKLPQADAETFGIYLHWLYTIRLAFTDYPLSDLQRLSGEERDARTRTVYESLFKLAILGDQLDDPIFQNLVVDTCMELRAMRMALPPPAAMWLLYTHLPRSSRLRHLLMHSFCATADPKDLDENRGENPPELYVDMAVELRKAALEGALLREPTRERRCDFHYHGGNIPKCS